MVGRINETRSAFDYLTKMYCCFKRFPVDSGYAFNEVLLSNIISILVALPNILRDTKQPLSQVRLQKYSYSLFQITFLWREQLIDIANYVQMLRTLNRRPEGPYASSYCAVSDITVRMSMSSMYVAFDSLRCSSSQTVPRRVLKWWVEDQN